MDRAKEVKVHIGTLHDVATLYDTEIETLREAFKNLNKTIDELRSSEWKSNAAEEFFTNYDGIWKVHMEKHITLLEHLRNCLRDADSTFTELYENNKILK